MLLLHPAHPIRAGVLNTFENLRLSCVTTPVLQRSITDAPSVAISVEFVKCFAGGGGVGSPPFPLKKGVRERFENQYSFCCILEHFSAIFLLSSFTSLPVIFLNF